MKKVFALMLAGLMLLMLIAACSDQEPTQQQPQPPAPPTTAPGATATPDPTTPGIDEPTDAYKLDLSGDFELALFSAKEATDRWWTEVIEAFKLEYPNLNVTYLITPVVGDEIRSRWIDNTPPDLVYLQGASATDVRALNEEGRFTPIDDFYSTAKVWGTETYVRDIVVSESNNFDLDGRPIGFPVEAGTYGFFYCQALAAQLGITQMPRNYDELWTLGEYLKSNHPNVALFAYGGQTALGYVTNQWFMPMLCEKDPDLFIRANTMQPGAWVDPWIIQSTEKIHALREFEMPGSIALTHTEAQIAWLQGHALFKPNGSWIEGEMLEDTPAGFQMAMIPYPTMEAANKPVSFFYVDTQIFIPKVSKNNNQDAAFEFMRFMYQDHWQRLYAEYAMNNPATSVSLEGVNTSSMVISVANMVNDPDLRVAQPRAGGFPVPRPDPRAWFRANQINMWLGEMTVHEFWTAFEAVCEEDRQSDDFVQPENSWIVKP